MVREVRYPAQLVDRADLPRCRDSVLADDQRPLERLRSRRSSRKASAARKPAAEASPRRGLAGAADWLTGSAPTLRKVK